mgnify:CR=1 FL=1|jgi:hypothetical protein
MEIMKDFFFLLILSIVYIFIKYGPGKEPFERFKNWFNADKKTSKIIRCQKSIQNIRKAGSEGCIDIDDELREKLTEFEIGLKSELNKVKEEKRNS